MDKNQKFHFLRAIGDYLERHIKGIDLTYIIDYVDGTGAISIYWFTTAHEDEVELTTFRLDAAGQIVDLPLSREEWMQLAPPLRAAIRAFNHIAYQTFAAISYADGLIEKEDGTHE